MVDSPRTFVESYILGAHIWEQGRFFARIKKEGVAGKCEIMNTLTSYSCLLAKPLLYH